ncbi:hypothetical protein IC229_22270 [Spirosoma sp. BT702]|uniref:Uncharacterized protein n=1 Tax=Spirosoma profusum TaxID=2771354 RepID=A0A926Y4P7_9BACT|nr:hypothetical protein [Spirosoma profusum]MBD2703386.1 hypothetical protein [Spirosoma profusum]
MKNWIRYGLILLLTISWGCSPKQPAPLLPDYMKIPQDLSNFRGSGRITIDGGLSLRTEGAEQLDAATKTYSGLIASVIGGSLLAEFTAGQPLAYRDNNSVPTEYRSNGSLRINSALVNGTYPMGINSPAGPRGERADLTLHLPGPQIYFTQDGSLTITLAEKLSQQGSLNLYQLRGSFTATLGASGVGTSPGKQTRVDGTFDLLVVSNL